MYIVKDSVTTDPDIMLREIENYKLQIPPFIQVIPRLYPHRIIENIVVVLFM